MSETPTVFSKGYLFLNDGTRLFVKYTLLRYGLVRVSLYTPKNVIFKGNTMLFDDDIITKNGDHEYRFILVCGSLAVMSIGREVAEKLAKHYITCEECSENRSKLTSRQASAAEMLALKSIEIEDVEYLLRCDVSDLPCAFHDYVQEYGEEYDEWCKKQVIDHSI